MMRAYSNDLRDRLVAAVERGEHSLREIAELFAVDLSCLVRILKRYRETGSVDPKPHAGGPRPKLDAAAQARLLELVREQPDATLAELHDRLGIDCCLMTMVRALQRNGLTRKKKTLHAEEQDSPRVQVQRAAFEEALATVNPAQLVFVDETGVTTAMTRTYGRALEGTRVVATAPGTWQNVTLIVGLRPSGVVAPFAFAGATDQAAFQTYVQRVLVPTLHPGDVVVWDNLAPHKSAEVSQAVESVGARVQQLPPWSPDKTPIEEMFSKTKEFVRAVGARTQAAVMEALGIALDTITLQDIAGWFHDRCAYAMP